jgi:agmatine deiminase
MIFPAEWSLHKATWTAWPDLPDAWLENQEPARKEWFDLCRAICLEGENPREELKIFVKSKEEQERVEIELAGLPLKFYTFDYGDVWLRDTGCIFSKTKNHLEGHVFRFNGWGEKYILARDIDLSREMALKARVEKVEHQFVFEGGAVDHNGKGLWITTEQCLLNENRNPGMTKVQYERAFHNLGAENICWIKEGLLNDHTDGHVDNILRFVNDETLLCMEPCGSVDPQAEVLNKIKNEAQAWASENNLKLLSIKSPGEVLSKEGDLMPASYMNFYIANNSVVLPLYGTKQDEAAVDELKKIFKTKKVIGLPSNHLLTGGGSFHCMTQQEPL